MNQRLQQGLRAIFAFTQSIDHDLVERYLTQDEMALFRQLALSEQLHSVNVLRDILEQSQQTPHDLAVAALLHDIGKCRKHMAVWQKTISVLVKTFLPKLDDKLSEDGELTFWRAPFILRRHHPKWGGQLLSDIQSSDCVIWLTTHHADDADDWHDHPYYELLIRLQQADDAN